MLTFLLFGSFLAGLALSGVAGFLWAFARRATSRSWDVESVAVAGLISLSSVVGLSIGGGLLAALAAPPLPFLLGYVYGNAVVGDAILTVDGRPVFTPTGHPLSPLSRIAEHAEPWRQSTDPRWPDDQDPGPPVTS